MDVKLWSHSTEGKIRTFPNVPVATADTMFREHSKLLSDPFVTYYRVTISDPEAGDRIVRDSDWEVHGIGNQRA